MRGLVFATIALAYIVISSQTSFAVSEQEREHISGMDTRQLVISTLSLSWDLRSKNQYHCYYEPKVGPQTCEHMDKVSGQYEDFHQSVMSGCRGSQLCPGASLNSGVYTYIHGTARLCQEWTTGSCEKVALTDDQMRLELMRLLDLRASKE